MATTSRPVLGAALTLPFIERYRSWLIEGQRDLEIQDFFDSSVLDGDWSARAKAIATVLDGHTGRVGIHGPFWGFKIDSQDPEIRAVVSKRFHQGLDVCGTLGATQMVIHSPFTTWDYNNLDQMPGARAQVAERVKATLSTVIRRAEDMGVELVIENIEDKDPHARVVLVDALASTAVKVSIDTGHAHYAHISTGAPPVDYYVSAAGERLAHVHIQDADGFADRHWCPGEGTILWPSVFRAVAQLTVKPRLVLELRDHNLVMKGWEHLKGLGLVD